MGPRNALINYLAVFSTCSVVVMTTTSSLKINASEEGWIFVRKTVPTTARYVLTGLHGTYPRALSLGELGLFTS